MPRGLSERLLLRSLEMYEPRAFGPEWQTAALRGDWLEYLGCKIEIDLMPLLAEF